MSWGLCHHADRLWQPASTRLPALHTAPAIQTVLRQNCRVGACLLLLVASLLPSGSLARHGGFKRSISAHQQRLEDLGRGIDGSKLYASGRPAGDLKAAVLTCEGEEAAQQAKMFVSKHWKECACPTHVWMERFQGMSPAGNKLVIDIGCNVGFTSAEAFDVWAPELGVNKRALLHAYTPTGAQADLGMCGGCKGECAGLHQTPSLLMGHRRVDVHCVEPGNLNFARLVQARQALFGGPAGEVSFTKRVGNTVGMWHLHNLAVSNATGSATFTSDCNSTLCHLGFGDTGAAASSYVVQVTTVDDLLAQIGNPSHVTFLKIDTEGFDALVLRGAEQALRSRVVQVLLFEYHEMNMWGLLQLKDTVDWLADLGYVCYFEGKTHLFKLSGSCWQPDYEVHRWSNVVCGLAGGHMELLLDAFTYLRVIKASETTQSVPVDAT